MSSSTDLQPDSDEDSVASVDEGLRAPPLFVHHRAPLTLDADAEDDDEPHRDAEAQNIVTSLRRMTSPTNTPATAAALSYGGAFVAGAGPPPKVMSPVASVARLSAPPPSTAAVLQPVLPFQIVAATFAAQPIPPPAPPAPAAKVPRGMTPAAVAAAAALAAAAEAAKAAALIPAAPVRTSYLPPASRMPAALAAASAEKLLAATAMPVVAPVTPLLLPPTHHKGSGTSSKAAVEVVTSPAIKSPTVHAPQGPVAATATPMTSASTVQNQRNKVMLNVLTKQGMAGGDVKLFRVPGSPWLHLLCWAFRI